MLKAGTAFSDISPKPGVGLAGYPHCPRPNKGVHDPLLVNCLYLNNGKEEIIFVTADCLYIFKQTIKNIRAKFKQKIFFTTSHTHCGPLTIVDTTRGQDNGCQPDPEYIEFFEKVVTETIAKSMEAPFDALIGTAVGRCGAEMGVGGNRRVPFGLCDPSVNVLAVKDTAGDVRSILVSYALHPTYLHADNELVSCDYPGYIRRFFHFAHPKATVMFAQGTSGNQSSRYHRVGQNFEEAARVGSTLGVEVFRCIEKMDFKDTLDVTVKTKVVELPLRKCPHLDELKAKLKIAEDNFEKSKSEDYITMRNAELALFGAQNLIRNRAVLSGEIVHSERNAELNKIILNDTMIATIPGEIFVEYGLAIKEASKYPKTFVFALSNGGSPGYIYTAEALAEGGYEVGTSMVDETAGSLIVDTINSL